MKSKRIVVVEDRDSRLDLFKDWFKTHDLACAKTVAGGAEYLMEKPADYLYLDFDLHDLGNDQIRHECRVPWNRKELDGLDMAFFTVSRLPKEMQPKQVVVHSRNPVGSLLLMRYLRKSGFKPTYWRFNYDYGR
jgi:hypothetical protein